MKQKRAYQYRIYPTDEQKKTLARTFGCVHFVYNWALRLGTDAYYERQERTYYSNTSARLTADERFWLCPECKAFHDRDSNAAKNVLAAGLAVSACGEAVRPGRAKALSGRAR